MFGLLTYKKEKIKMLKNIKTFIVLSSLTFLALVSSSCEKVVDQLPQTAIPSEIKDASSARASLLGAYDALQSANYYGNRMITLPDLHGGNLRHTGTFPSFAEFSNRAILTNNAEVTNMWATLYNGILRMNFIISAVPNIDANGFPDKDQIIAEAQFLRALNYFTLVKYWGDVPIITSPTTKADESLKVPRSTVADVYKQINADLDAAIAKLPLNSAAGRANRYAAYALKSRAALYNKEWDNVITNTDLIINSRKYTLPASYSAVFGTKNSSESIMELQFSNTDQSGIAFFMFTSTLGGRNEVRPSTGLIAAYDAADTRKMLATSYDVAIKYYRIANQDDNVLVFRYAETILSKAEALVEQGKMTDALPLLNQIRVRAGLTASPASLALDQPAMRDEIFKQRRLELALEGHYFFDLVRTGRARTTLTTWADTQRLLPIPQREIEANSALKQNDGY
jgi:starch-binding outer membrane protein, SusD/RagB family